jgi:hypothetical protein
MGRKGVFSRSWDWDRQGTVLVGVLLRMDIRIVGSFVLYKDTNEDDSLL